MSIETLRMQEARARSETLRALGAGVGRETLCKQEVKLCVSREKGQGVKLTLRRDQE